MKHYFQEMFRYERWANERILAHLESSSPDARQVAIFSHLIADAKPWLSILRGETVPDGVDTSPQWSVAECRLQLTEMQDAIDEIIAALDENDFRNVVSSFSPNGLRFDNTVTEVLTHLLSHGQHHRGQIEWLVEQNAGNYFPTSYMPYLRMRDRTT